MITRLLVLRLAAIAVQLNTIDFVEVAELDEALLPSLPLSQDDKPDLQQTICCRASTQVGSIGLL